MLSLMIHAGFEGGGIAEKYIIRVNFFSNVTDLKTKN